MRALLISSLRLDYFWRLQATQYMEIVEIDFGILGIIRGLGSAVLWSSDEAKQWLLIDGLKG